MSRPLHMNGTADTNHRATGIPVTKSKVEDSTLQLSARESKRAGNGKLTAHSSEDDFGPSSARSSDSHDTRQGQPQKREYVYIDLTSIKIEHVEDTNDTALFHLAEIQVPR